MAGLEPATHSTAKQKQIIGALTRACWVAGSSPAMVNDWVQFKPGQKKERRPTRRSLPNFMPVT
jgi:hypothetical protein